MQQQDYLYMFQVCIALGALLAFYFAFKYETLDKYADNRKEILRHLFKALTNYPERIEWIQSIGKPGNESNEKQMLSQNIPSTDKLINEIKLFREHKSKLMTNGIFITLIWVVTAFIYLLSQTFNWYGSSPCWSWWPYKVIMLLFFVACLKTCCFLWKAKK